MNDDYRLLVSIRSASRLVAVALLALVAPTSRAHAATAADSVDIRLVAQNFNVGTQRQLRFVIGVGDEVTRAELSSDPTSTVNIAFGRPLTSRTQITTALDSDGDFERVAELSLRVRQLQRNVTEDWVVLTSLVGELRRLTTGVYPVVVEVLRGDERVGAIVTFVNLYSEAEDFPALPVSLALSVVAKNSFTPQGAIEVGARTRDQLAALAALVELGPAPISVHVAPHLLEALSRSVAADDIALRDRLGNALQRHELIPTTFVPFDPSSAARSALDEEFAEQLQAGETTIDRFNGDAAFDRTVWFSPVPVDRDGVSLLRQLGFQSLVLAPQAAEDLGSLDNYAKPYRVDGSATSASMALRTVDPFQARLLSAPSTRQLTSVYALAADVLVGRAEIIASGGDPTTRHVVLSTWSGEPPPLTVGGPLLVALSRAPQLVVRPLTSASVSVTTATSVGLPRADRVSLLERREPLQEIVGEIASTATMLERNAPQQTAWTIARLSCGHDELSDEQFTSCLRGLRGQLRVLRNNVSVPESLTFTLGGRESELRLQVRNTSSQPLSAIVSMESAKLQFPEGPQRVTVPANSSLDLLFPVRARANGRFPVEVVLTTPDGLTQVGRRISMTARVNALAGLGQVVTGAATIILLTWWVSHWRRKRRAKATLNHPAVH